MSPAAPGRHCILDDLDVIVDDELLVDVVRAGDMLVLRNGQTHENAVEQVVKLFPGEHIDDITRIVRTHMPHAPSLENLTLQLAAASPEWVNGDLEPAHVPMSRRKVQVITGVVAAGVAALSIGVYALLSHLSAGPFDDPQFTQLAAAANFECRTQTDTTAECRNTAEGTLWQVTAYAGLDNDPTSYRFSRGNQLAVVWIFPTQEAREKFPRLAAYERLYPFLSSRDRVIVGSTDQPIMASLAGALDNSILHGVGRGAAPSGTGSLSPFESWPTVEPTGLVPWPTDGQGHPATPTATGAPETSSAPAGRPVTDGSSQAATEAPSASPAGNEAPAPASSEASRPAPSSETGTPVPEQTPSGDQPNSGGGNSQGGGTGQEQPATPPSKSDPTGLITIRLPGITLGL